MMSVAFIAVTFLGQVVPQESLSDANSLRNALRERLASFNSIECSYTYCCNNRTQERLDHLDLRWKDGWLWYASRPNSPSEDPDAHNLLMEAIVDTKVSGYWDKLKNSDRYFHTNYDRLRFMAYNELSPLTALGVSSQYSYDSYTNNLREALEAPITPHMEKHDQQTLLYLYSEPLDGNYSDIATTHGIIVYFDDQGCVGQVDYILRPSCSLDEVRILAGTDAPRNIYRLFARDVFENYHDVDGYSIPTKLHRTRFETSRTEEFISLLENYNEQFKNGLLTLCELDIKIRMAAPGNYIKKEWEVFIDPDSIRINNPDLTKADFAIVPPQTPSVTWDITSGDFISDGNAGNLEEVRKESEERRIAAAQAKQQKNYALPISVAIVAISAALLATAIILKRNGKP